MDITTKKMKHLSIMAAIFLFSACQNTTPNTAPPVSGPATITLAAGTITLGNQVLDGPLLGCADAAELINQTITLPAMPITLDAQNIFDRVDTSATSATYTFSIRPVNPLDCSSTTLPAVGPTTVTFGFTYSGDFSRVDPICINASVLNLNSFSVTGTPIDALIEPFFREALWNQLDQQIADRMHSLLNGGTRPEGAAVRCDNWVDQSTL